MCHRRAPKRGHYHRRRRTALCPRFLPEPFFVTFLISILRLRGCQSSTIHSVCIIQLTSEDWRMFNCSRLLKRNLDTNIQIQNNKYTNTNTKPQIHKYKYKTKNTQIQTQNNKYTNTMHTCTPHSHSTSRSHFHP